MPIILWDASGLAKRYTDEAGKETVNALFASVPVSSMATTAWGYAETRSILLKKYNSGVLSASAFRKAKDALQAEVLDPPGFDLVSISDGIVFGSLPRMEAHSLNATDAAILTTYLRYRQALPVASAPCLLVASDKRLVRASEAEGLKTLNPEMVAAADVPAFPAAL